MAQQNNDDWCSQDCWGRDRAGVCQVREPPSRRPRERARLQGRTADHRRRRVAWRRRVLAKVVATAEIEPRAKTIADAVHLTPTLDLVEADGPRDLQNREGWSVSYRISVPRALNLSLKTSNGGITVREVESKVTFGRATAGSS